MKVWVVKLEVRTVVDDYTPCSNWRDIEMIFDSKDGAISYVRDRIKNAIDEQEMWQNSYLEVINYIPTDEELCSSFGVWFKTDNEVYSNDYRYIIEEHIVI